MGVNLFSTKEYFRSNKLFKLLILGGENQWIKSTFGECQKISNMEAYNIFGIVGMEEAVEKTYTCIEYTSQSRDIKIDKILSI